MHNTAYTVQAMVQKEASLSKLKASNLNPCHVFVWRILFLFILKRARYFIQHLRAVILMIGWLAKCRLNYQSAKMPRIICIPNNIILPNPASHRQCEHHTVTSCSVNATKYTNGNRTKECPVVSARANSSRRYIQHPKCFSGSVNASCLHHCHTTCY